MTDFPPKISCLGDLNHDTIEFYIGTIKYNKYCRVDEVQRWKDMKKWEGCVYSVPKPIAKCIRKRKYIFVIEMNNNTNKIEGIGFIRNIDNLGRNTGIHHDMKYNLYNYNSSFHVGFKDMCKKDNGNYIEFLTRLLFYGRSHYKRGPGIITVSPSRFNTLDYYHKTIDYFKSLFPKIPFDKLKTYVPPPKRGRPPNKKPEVQ